jgi:hypothetical protein
VQKYFEPHTSFTTSSIHLVLSSHALFLGQYTTTMTGQTVWSTPRKGRVLYDAVQWRKAGGSIPKLALKRKEEDVDWPSNKSVRRWLQHYDTLKKQNPQKSERELLDEASRSGRTYPLGHRAKISGGVLDELADGTPTISG